ncbi:MAG: class 1 fructose-bisphosphatase [Sulfurovum sp.]|nr:class 1 fructose-bisphosphatase [Sulfurovum sp.]
MQQIFEMIKTIAIEIGDLIINQEMGYTDDTNTTGDQQLKLDIACDLLIEKRLKETEIVKAIISEEKEGVIPCNQDGEFTVCYDPLDGSSIVDANLAVGSIFGIYKGEPKGESLVASAYIVFGPRIELVTIIRGEKPYRYRLVGSSWQQLGAMSIKDKGKLNASGGTQKYWYPKHKKFIYSLFDEGYRLRYSGGMVPDLHQILVKEGGLFSYPGTEDSSKGKLRMLFEVFPYALVFEAAGGYAIDENGKRLLELVPEHPHDKTPCFFGSNYEINRLKEAYGVL